MNEKSQNSTRLILIDGGIDLVCRKGFSATSISDILEKTALPKGCFYHYFESKDQFGRVLLETSLKHSHDDMTTWLDCGSGDTRDNLLSLFWHWAHNEEQHNLNLHNLVIKIGAEVVNLSDDMRSIVIMAIDSITARLTRAFEAGLMDGSLPARGQPAANAEVLFNLWFGASLSAIIHKDRQVMERAYEVVTTLLTFKARQRRPPEVHDI